MLLYGTCFAPLYSQQSQFSLPAFVLLFSRRQASLKPTSGFLNEDVMVK